MTYDSYKTATPPEYEEDGERDGPTVHLCNECNEQVDTVLDIESGSHRFELCIKCSWATFLGLAEALSIADPIKMASMTKTELKKKGWWQ